MFKGHDFEKPILFNVSEGVVATEKEATFGRGSSGGGDRRGRFAPSESVGPFDEAAVHTVRSL